MAVEGPIITASAAGLVAPVVNFLLQLLKSKMDDPSLDESHKALGKGLQWLLALRQDKDNEISRDIQKEPSNVYLCWTERVSRVQDRVASLDKEYKELGRLNFCGREALKTEIKKELKEQIELLETCPKEVAVKLPERVIKEPGVPSITEYPTLQNAFQEILTLLQNNGERCVALHGAKGVGKTTIMQNLNNHFYNKNKELFDMVIFIKLPSDKQTEDLQILQKIADRINVNEEGDESKVAGKIQKVLEDKKYLLILDGVRRAPNKIWEKLDISKHKKKSKMVITTYFPLALSHKFVESKVVVKRLRPEEAQAMFQDIYGKPLSPEAEQVCDRLCCCLPLLIAPIANSFIHEESRLNWERVLEECTPWPQVEVQGLEELYSILQICYQQLGDRSKQKCFLYASLYPANSKISTEYFLECCIAQGFLSDVADTKYSKIRKEGIVRLRHLINAALLEEGEEMRYVKMNDLHRQLALHISSNDPNSECKTYVDNGEDREDRRSESWQRAKWVSMVGSKRDSLPANQNYGSLQTLLLQKSLALDQIPFDFFQSMGSLLVLNLYGTKISKLPSLSGLTSLKVFYINGCSGLKIFPNQIQPLKLLRYLTFEIPR